LLPLSGILKTSGLIELEALESHISLLIILKRRKYKKICPYFLTNGYKATPAVKTASEWIQA
jgi:hypothetical protein